MVEGERKLGEGFDRTLITLSGGALVLSVAFIKDIITPSAIVLKGFLALAWGSWAVSLAALLIAYYVGIRSYRHAIQTLGMSSYNQQNPGGYFATATQYFNALGCIGFLVGLIAFVYFALENIGV